MDGPYQFDDEDNPRTEADHQYCHEGDDYAPFQDVHNTKPLALLTLWLTGALKEAKPIEARPVEPR